jgi:hypothetical protein
MPLNTPLLATELAAAFQSLEPTIKASLLAHFADPLPLHTALGVDEDERLGGVVENTKNSVFSVQEAIDKWAIENAPGNLDTVQKRVDFKNQLWTVVAAEWADCLSAHISSDIVKALVAQLSPLLADIIVTNIKRADLVVTIPPGTLTVGVGASAILNPVPIELTLSPTFSVPDAIAAAKIPVVFIGGIK